MSNFEIMVIEICLVIRTRVYIDLHVAYQLSLGHPNVDFPGFPQRSPGLNT